MAKKHKHEDHINHEAWAIPYGDLVTLLLAFFVVMYAVSSVNEGKYRVLAEALSESFGGTPKSMKPIQFGKQQQHGSNADEKLSPTKSGKPAPSVAGKLRDSRNPTVFSSPDPALMPTQQNNPRGNTGYSRSQKELSQIGEQVERALGSLIADQQIRVRKTEVTLEIEMDTDILFHSGSARVEKPMLPTLGELAGILKPFPHELRIEGHTDNVPIRTAAFPSNWELSAARAAGVVHLFMDQGVDAARMSVAGLGEHHPATANDTPEGRSRNRRVVIVVQADPNDPLEADVPVAAAETPAPEVEVPLTVTVPEGTLQSLSQTSPEHPNG